MRNVLSESSSPPLRLQGYVQHYEWGGFSFIPHFLGIRNEEQKPYAELWWGAHPQGPARVMVDEKELDDEFQKIEHHGMGLGELIQTEPMRWLGPEVVNQFGPTLPFLLKMLDARQMLSIQVHPSKDQAEAGFAAEEAAQLPLDAPQRNYKDRNHKPEAQVALTDFYLLHGFRPLAEIADMMTAIPSFAALAPDWDVYVAEWEPDDERAAGWLQELYGRLMQLPQAEVDAAINPLLARIEPLYDSGQLTKISPHYWAVRAARLFSQASGHRDRGIFSLYLLNLLHLKPGQGTFQPAGLPHAYLEGATIEIMANSDNVLRGGLTHKHIDITELLKIIQFKPIRSELLPVKTNAESEQIFITPVDDFQLSRIQLQQGQIYHSLRDHGPEILVLLSGSVKYGNRLWKKGESYFIPAHQSYHLESLTTTVIFKATVPL